MKKLITNTSHFLYALLVAVLLVGCEKSGEEIEEKKSFDTTKMDLGMALWRNKIQTFDGNVKQADSAYEIDKKILIDYIYKTADKVEEKKKVVNEKECGHIFFNRYCSFCVRDRFDKNGF